MNPQAKIPWRERGTYAGTVSDPAFAVPGYTTGANTFYPLPALTKAEAHKWLRAIKDVRIVGTITDTLTSESVSVDFLASDVAGFVQPTELNRLKTFGFRFQAYFDNTGTLVAVGDPSVWGLVYLQIGENFGMGFVPLLEPGEFSQVIVDDADHYLPFYVQIDSVNAAVATFVDAEGGPAPSAASATLTFGGHAVPLYVSNSDIEGSIAIDVPATGGWLEWNGLRDPDTGHFTTNSV